MDALLSKVIKSDEASMDAFMSSPIMQTTMQSKFISVEHFLLPFCPSFLV